MTDEQKKELKQNYKKVCDEIKIAQGKILELKNNVVDLKVKKTDLYAEIQKLK